jgi:hypothetical protein
MKKDAYYFSHDGNANSDEKILMLRADFGWEGYGIYWLLIELMFQTKETALKHSLTKGIAIGNNIDITLLSGVINTCITLDLFTTDEAFFWSESLRRRKVEWENSKVKKSEAGKRGMEKRWGKKNNTVITPDNRPITENNKGKERKGKEINNNTPVIPLQKHRLQAWIEQNCPRVAKLQEPITFDEANKILEKHSWEFATDLLGEMENYRQLKTKYISAYRTFLKWASMRQTDMPDKPKVLIKLGAKPHQGT